MCRIHVRHRIAAVSVPFLELFLIMPTDSKAQCELLDCHAESATSVEPRKKAPAIRAGATDKSFPVIVQYGD